VTARARRTVGNVFVLHGCLLDAVKCLYSVPFATSLLRRGAPDSCSLLGASFVLVVTASAINILAIVCSEAYSFRSAAAAAVAFYARRTVNTARGSALARTD